MALPKPPLANKHIEERLKLGANCLQALALALAGAAIVAPLIITRTELDWRNALAVLIAGLAEGAAFILLRYIPVTAVP